MNNKNPRMIQSVQRALDIINCFDSLHTQLTLTEISEKLQLNISTVHGLINTMSAYSYIVKNPNNGKYRLGLEFILKANLVTQSLDLKEIGHNYLKKLTTTYSETSHLYVYQQEQIFCVDKVESPNNYFIISSRAGSKLPMHASASGKVFLAHMSTSELDYFLQDYSFQALTSRTITSIEELMTHLQHIARIGYGIEDEEIEENAYSLAAPIKDAHGKVVATISLIGSLNRMKEKEAYILEDLIEAAYEISSQLGYKQKQTSAL
ncbi:MULTISPECIES: IclR family transcriptional regulator [Paenibacillus]|uniref:IclR family transcriptional regulator n=1 Tax=Paenibacillus TaxID=44249 RepID=UPI00203D7301|nr:IclR family transcriptional regulator [Paenibacillus camelliae]MCM3634520.1 IclR family transcriptional regulator [Paenibacillus camelliae]